ncbi:type IV secretion system protein [Candidatus Fokinia crypta]|uniref:VirB6/TrlB type IV secretion protein n=1 Tax=Candidatus Fokinia crypta TaxID=1920990 RepID=A0ABZ0UQT4_9RICK|nr:hypothetical protein [Candidatus Fokinia cryptica]WPX97922.1 VirB6/TrlB type IV secretion protein [Candidatus Fokinia cryptica]
MLLFIGSVLLPEYSFAETLPLYSKCIFGYDNKAVPQESVIVTPHGCQSFCDSNCSIFNKDVDPQNFSACYSYCVQGLPYTGNPIIQVATSTTISNSSTTCATQSNSGNVDCSNIGAQTVSKYYYGDAISAIGCPGAILATPESYTPSIQQASGTFSYSQGAKYSEMEISISFETENAVCPNGNLYVTLTPVMSNLFQRAPEGVVGGNAAENALNNDIYNKKLNFSFAANAINAVANFGTTSSDTSAMGEWCPDIDNFESCWNNQSGNNSYTSNSASADTIQQSMMHPCFAGFLSAQANIKGGNSIMGTGNLVEYLYNVDLSYIYGSDHYNPQSDAKADLTTIISYVNNNSMANGSNPIVGCFPQWRLNGPPVPIARSMSEEPISLQVGDSFSITWGGDVFVTTVLYNSNGLLMPISKLSTTSTSDSDMHLNMGPADNAMSSDITRKSGITDLRDLTHLVMNGSSLKADVELSYEAASTSSCTPPALKFTITELLNALTGLTIVSNSGDVFLQMPHFTTGNEGDCGSYRYCQRDSGSRVFEFCTKSSKPIIGLYGNVQQNGIKIQPSTKSQDRKEKRGHLFKCKHVLDPGLPVYTFSGQIDTALGASSIQMPLTYFDNNSDLVLPSNFHPSSSANKAPNQCYSSSNSSGYLGFSGGYQATIQWCGNRQINGQGLQIAIADPSVPLDSLTWHTLRPGASGNNSSSNATNTISIGGEEPDFIITGVKNNMVTIGTEKGTFKETGTLEQDIDYNIYFRLEPDLFHVTRNKYGYITYPPVGQYKFGVSQRYRGVATLTSGNAPQNISWPQAVIQKFLTLMFGSNICSVTQNTQVKDNDTGVVWIVMNEASTIISRYVSVIIAIAIFGAGIGFLAGVTKVSFSEVIAVIARLIIVMLLVQPNTVQQSIAQYSSSKNFTLNELIAKTSICSGLIAASYVTPSIKSDGNGNYQYEPSLNGIFEVTLETWYVLVSSNTWVKVWSLVGVGLCGIMFAGIIITGLVYSLFLVCITMLMYIYLVIGIAVVTIPMPLFAICLLFSSTRPMAYQYGKKFICFALYDVALSAGVTLIDVVITSIVLSTLSFTVCDAIYVLKILGIPFHISSWVPLITTHSPPSASTLLPISAMQGGLALSAVGYVGVGFVKNLLSVIDKIVDPNGGTSGMIVGSVNKIQSQVKESVGIK